MSTPHHQACSIDAVGVAVSKARESQVFGKRAQKHVIIVASGDKVRHMTFQPWMVALSISFLSVFSIGYLAATSYLVLRDDLIGGTMARQARMQHEYEDRIAALRAQVDRVTSRQLLDQQVVEDKVEKLLQQQMALSSRHGKLGTLLERAEQSGLSETVPAEHSTLAPPGKRADAGGGIHAIERLMGIAGKQTQHAALAYAPAAAFGGSETVSDKADRLFSKVTLSLKDIEQDQKRRIENLTADAAATSDTIVDIVSRTGLRVSGAPQPDAMSALPEPDIGGPFVEPETTEEFDNSLVSLDMALARLEHVRNEAKKLPFSNPSPASDITSRFGNRPDPFFGRLALHAGIDFRAPTGTRILATAPGTVVTAGRAGSYGNMVEIDHGNGLSTRYAHLSSILVNVGDTIDAGEGIGRSGSTGRSTGPHLHYEVRLHGEAVDPMRFLTAGIKLSSYIN